MPTSQGRLARSRCPPLKLTSCISQGSGEGETDIAYLTPSLTEPGLPEALHTRLTPFVIFSWVMPYWPRGFGDPNNPRDI